MAEKSAPQTSKSKTSAKTEPSAQTTKVKSRSAPKTKLPKISVLVWNINTNSNLKKIKRDVECPNYNDYDVLCFLESKSANPITFENFNFLVHKYYESFIGGITVYTRKSGTVIEIDDCIDEEIFETLPKGDSNLKKSDFHDYLKSVLLWLKITYDGKETHIGIVYAPGGDSNFWKDRYKIYKNGTPAKHREHFFIHIAECVKSLSSEGKMVILAGDLNLHSQNYQNRCNPDNSSTDSTFTTLIENAELYIMNGKCKYKQRDIENTNATIYSEVTNVKSSVIDYVMVNWQYRNCLSEFKVHPMVDTPIPEIHHKPITFTADLSQPHQTGCFSVMVVHWTRAGRSGEDRKLTKFKKHFDLLCVINDSKIKAEEEGYSTNIEIIEGGSMPVEKNDGNMRLDKNNSRSVNLWQAFGHKLKITPNLIALPEKKEALRLKIDNSDFKKPIYILFLTAKNMDVKSMSSFIIEFCKQEYYSIIILENHETDEKKVSDLKTVFKKKPEMTICSAKDNTLVIIYNKINVINMRHNNEDCVETNGAALSFVIQRDPKNPVDFDKEAIVNIGEVVPPLVEGFCGKCKEKIGDNLNVQCNICKNKYHLSKDCVKMKASIKSDLQALKDTGWSWFCEVCRSCAQ